MVLLKRGFSLPLTDAYVSMDRRTRLSIALYAWNLLAVNHGVVRDNLQYVYDRNVDVIEDQKVVKARQIRYSMTRTVARRNRKPSRLRTFVSKIFVKIMETGYS